MVFITSFYNKIKYQYLMIKDGNSVNIDLINTEATEEDNGLEVRIDNIDLYKYLAQLDSLIFFPNLYIKGDNRYIIDYNNSEIKHFNNFSVTSSIIRERLLLGNVLYPLNENKIDAHLVDGYSNFIDNNHVVIKFDIGELEVTPNRESILYSQNTINKINERIKDAIDEICDIISKHIAKDYNNLWDYINNLSLYRTLYDFFTDELITNMDYVSYSYLRVDGIKVIKNLSSRNKPLPTYKGEDLSNDVEIYMRSFRTLKNKKIPFIAGILDNGNNIYTSKVPWRLQDSCLTLNSNIIILPEDVTLYGAVKSYFKDKYNSEVYAIIRHSTKEEFLTALSSSDVIDNKKEKEITFKLYEEYYDYVHNIGILFNPNDKEFLDFKKELKKSQKKEEPIRDITIKLYHYDGWYRGIEKSFTTLSGAKEFIEKCNKGVILTNKRNINLEELKKIAAKRNLIIATVNLNLVSKFVDISNVIDPDDILGLKSNFIKSLITYKNLIFKEGLIDERDITNIKYFIRDSDRELIKYYLDTEKEWYNYTRYIKDEFKNDNNLYDEDLVRAYNTLKKYANIGSKFQNNMQDSGIYTCVPDIFIIYLLTKSKAFRVNKAAYLEMAKSKIIKSIRHENY